MSGLIPVNRSREIISHDPAPDWDNSDFTITTPEYFFVNASYPDVLRHQKAMEELKKEAIRRGYTVNEWQSMDTMIRYTRFVKNKPAMKPTAIDAVEIMPDVKLLD